MRKQDKHGILKKSTELMEKHMSISSIEKVKADIEPALKTAYKTAETALEYAFAVSRRLTLA